MFQTFYYLMPFIKRRVKQEKKKGKKKPFKFNQFSLYPTEYIHFPSVARCACWCAIDRKNPKDPSNTNVGIFFLKKLFYYIYIYIQSLVQEKFLWWEVFREVLHRINDVFREVFCIIKRVIKCQLVWYCWYQILYLKVSNYLFKPCLFSIEKGFQNNNFSHFIFGRFFWIILLLLKNIRLRLTFESKFEIYLV